MDRKVARKSSHSAASKSLIANPMPWPNGARCAVAITFDIDTDSFLHLEQGEQAPKILSALVHGALPAAGRDDPQGWPRDRRPRLSARGAEQADARARAVLAAAPD